MISSLHHLGQAIVSLTQQYRMNREIMSLANELVYNGTLRCATHAVASARLSMSAPLSSVFFRDHCQGLDPP
jgi:hypothetical protein